MPSRGRVQVSITGENAGLKRTVADSEGQLGKLNTAVEKHGKSLLNAAKAATGLAAGYAAITDAKDAVDTTTELAHATLVLHRNLGLSVKSASEFAGVAKVRGIETKALTQSFGTLSKQFVALEGGSKKTVAAFKSLGITQKEVAGKPFEQQLNVVADAFGKMHGGAQRASLGMQLFGRGWQTVLPLMSQGKKGLQDQLALADKYGVTLGGKTVKSLEELIRAQRESKFATLGLQVAFGTVLAPAMTKGITAVNKFVLGIRTGTGAGGKFADAMKPIVTVLGSVAKLLRDHPKLIAGAVAAWGLYKTAGIAATAVTRAKIIASFVGLGPKAAVAGAETGAAFGTAASTSASARMRAFGWGGAGRVAGGLIGTAMIAEIVSKLHDGQGGIASTLKDIFNVVLPLQPRGPGSPTKPFKAPKGSPPYQRDNGPLRANPANPTPTSGPTHLPTPTTKSRPTTGAPAPGQNSPGGHRARISTVAATAAGVATGRGPARVTGAATDKRKQALALMQRIWASAAASYGRAGKPMPRVQFTSNSMPIVGTSWNPGSSKADTAVVYWPDWITDWLLGYGKPGDRDIAFATLLHEWAHYFQVSGLSDAVAEGGAQAFARQVAPKVASAVGISYKNEPFGADQYTYPSSTSAHKGGAVGLVKATKGPGFIMSGQFRGGVKSTGATARAARAGGVLSFEQLQSLWIQAGGAPSMAQLMAHVALAESGGNPHAYNASGATGLWQILGAMVPGDLYDPLVNARNAVAKYKSQGLGAWAASRGTWGQYAGLQGQPPTVSTSGGAAGSVAGAAVKAKPSAADIAKGLAAPAVRRLVAGQATLNKAIRGSTAYAADIDTQIGLVTKRNDLTTEDTTTPGGRIAHVFEQRPIAALQAQKVYALANQRNSLLAKVKGYRSAIAGLTRQMRGAKKAVRQQLAGRIQHYQGLIAQAKADARALGFTIADAMLDLQGTVNDISDAYSGTGTYAAPAATAATGLDLIPGANAGMAAIDKEGALAALTADPGDDIKAAQDLVTGTSSILTYEQQNPGFTDSDIADAARNLKSAQDALDSLTSAVTDNTNAMTDLQAKLDLQTQIAQDAQRNLNTSQSQYAVIAKAIFDIANTGIGGRIGLGFQSVSYAGGVAKP